MSTVETLEFQAETRQLLDLMIHSLYKHKEIFLRELISNASDALDKLRVEAVTRPELLAGDERLHVRLEADSTARTLRVIDNGIGMSRDELVANIGTIASSGTGSFLEEMAKLRDEGQAGAELPALIGQFGVGFYSSFMVADEVVVETRRAGGDQGLRWSSRGTNEYTIEEIDRPERGTSITLHLKRHDASEGEQDFTAEWVLRDVVKRYSDFIEYPIELDVEREQVERDEDGKEVEGGRRETVTETVTLNSMKPLWTRPKADVTPEEYAEFYKHLTHDWEDPLETIHFRAEGSSEYTALLFVPRRRQMDLFDPSRASSRVSLYVKRVFIMDDCEELLPPWLRFVRGLVDSADLPLNVSRETLQHGRQMGPIRKRLTRKVIEALQALLADRREDYVTFWESAGTIVKEGIYYDDEHRRDVAGLALFHTTAGDEPSTLGEVVLRMPVGQKAIYTIAGEDRAKLAASPHLEALRKKGYEVVYLTDQVDEFALSRLTEFEGKPIRSVERGEVDLEDEQAKAERQEKQAELGPLLEAVKERLADEVAEVRVSTRLTESPAVLVASEHGLSANQERILRAAQQEVPESKRILELNPEHPVVTRLEALRTTEGAEERFGETCELLHGLALLAEGSTPKDLARFSRQLSHLLAGGDA